MVAFETLHYLKNHNLGKNGFMAIKLDISKAYDRVEWSFLREVMKRMGFNDKWVELVMECVSTMMVCCRKQPKIKPILLKIYVVVRVRIVPTESI